MKKELIVSIMSEQLAPNLILIKNLHECDLCCIATEAIRKKEILENFEKAIRENLDYKGNFEQVDVDNRNANDITEKLNQHKELFDKYSTLHINITGGTKLMSLFVYNFFIDNYKDKSKIYYLDLGYSSTEYLMPLENKTFQTNKELTLKEYLDTYRCKMQEGKHYNLKKMKTAEAVLKSINSNKFMTERKYLQSLYELISGLKDKKRKATKGLNNFIHTVKEKYKNNKVKHNKIEEIKQNKDALIYYCDYLSKNSSLNNAYNVTYSDISYIISSFLEEYIYYQIKDKIFTNSKYEDIDQYLRQSLKIQYIDKEKTYNTNDQELDILFIYSNKLYYIECKSSADKTLIQASIYKQFTVAKTLGLNIKNYLFINNISDNTPDINNLESTAKLHNVTLFINKKVDDMITQIKKDCNIK